LVTRGTINGDETGVNAARVHDFLEL
jgi:hypothetical protein